MNSLFVRILVVMVGLGGLVGSSCDASVSSPMYLTGDVLVGAIDQGVVSKDLLTLESVLAVQAKAHGCFSADEDVISAWESASTLSGRAWFVYGRLFACLLEAETCAEYMECTGIDVESDCDPKTFTSYCSDAYTVTQCATSDNGYSGHIQNYNCAALEPYNTQCQPRLDRGAACMGGAPGQYPDGCQGNVLYLSLDGGVLTKIDCADLDLTCVNPYGYPICRAFPDLEPIIGHGRQCVGNVVVEYEAHNQSPFGVRTDCSWAGPGFVCNPSEGNARCEYQPEECIADGHWAGGGLENRDSCGICYRGKQVFEPCAIIPGSTCIEIPQCDPAFGGEGSDFYDPDDCQGWGPRCGQEEFAH